jgi:hypothetical protein
MDLNMDLLVEEFYEGIDKNFYLILTYRKQQKFKNKPDFFKR